MDGRLARGARTRTAVLDAAVALATESGLDGLSLGELAERLGVSKSGLFAHWRSKEDLQLAAVDRAREQWVDRIVAPGPARTRAACAGCGRCTTLRLAFYESGTLPGGCFFAVADVEFVTRTGPVRDRLSRRCTTGSACSSASPPRRWPPASWLGIPPGQVAFEVNAAGTAAVYQARLSDAGRPPTGTRAARSSTGCAPPARDPSLLPEAVHEHAQSSTMDTSSR